MSEPLENSTVDQDAANPPGATHATIAKQDGWLARLNAWQWAIAIAVLAAVLLPGLGRAGLLDPWEMDRAAVARRMAMAPRVVVIEGPSGTLLSELEQKYGTSYQFSRGANRADATAVAALQQAAQRLTREVAHAVIVDTDALAQPGSNLVEAATALALIESQNKGLAVILTGSGSPTELATALAKARARALGPTWRGPGTAGWLDKDTDAEALWPLLAGSEATSTRAQLGDVLGKQVPSPWTWPVHKRDGQLQAVPWLDAALTGASLRALGPTETAARLPSALLILLTGLWCVAVGRRLWGRRGGWLALLAMATLPSTLGFARILTFETAPVLGTALVAGALALGAAGAAQLWWVWYALGAAILLLGQGLAGAVVAATLAVAWLAVAPQRRLSYWAVAIGASAFFAVALATVLGDQESWLLRGLRFTQSPFSAGPDQYHRDFAWFVGQLGFASFPWGPAVAVGLGGLLASDREAAPQRWQAGAALLLALVIPYAVVAVLIRSFHHFVLPATGVMVLAAAAMLGDLLDGRIKGRTAAVFIALASLLLHHEISHGADAVTRFLAFDPPLQPPGGTGNLVWPEGLALPKPLHMLTLLAVMAFAVGLGQPFSAIQATVVRLRSAQAAGWTLGLLGLGWAVDALVSLGTKLDVLLKTQAQTTGYAYDRLWVTIQDTRPEVMAAAAATGLLVLVTLTASVGDPEASWRRFVRPLGRFAQFVARPAVALSLGAVGAVMVLLSGLTKFTQLHADLGMGGALTAGLGGSAFLAPVALVILAALARLLLPADDRDSLWSPLARWTRDHALVALGLLGLMAVAGIGIGASQASGTWSFPLYLVGCWWLALLGVLVAVGTAQGAAGMTAWPTVAAGAMAMLVLFGPLTGRYIQETQPTSDAYLYLVRVLIAAPDSALWLVLAAAVALNRWAAGRERWLVLLDRLVALAGKLEQPRWAMAALMAAGICFATGYAYTLLPGLSLHFSQKHLLQRIADAGGQGPDTQGEPRTFAHGGQSGGDNNFYMQSLPIIEDRQTVLSLLGGDNVTARVVDNASGGTSRLAALPGWEATLDADHNGQRDVPAYFGLVSKAEGTHVQLTKAQWQPGQWTGAAVYAPAGQTATVVDNGKDELTLSQPLNLTSEDSAKSWIILDKAKGENDWKHAADKAVQRFVILPRDGFSDLNHVFRQAHAGQQIALLDDSSSRLVLAANFLLPTQPDQNWLKKSLITEAEVVQQKGYHKMFANFDNAIHLIGYKLVDNAVSRSQKYKMTLYWKVAKGTNVSWKLFMHPHPLHLDRWPLTEPDPSEDENKPCNGCFQTNHWLPGDVIADYFEQEVPLGTNAGPNEIILGWYNPSSDTRLPLLSATGPGVIKHGDNRVTIGHLQVR